MNMISRTRFRISAIVGVGLLVSTLARAGLGQEKASAYPRVNVATAYAVDPTWPDRPTTMPWGEMSGLAVDAHDHVWVFTRAVPPVQVYDAKGKFVRAWGDESIKGAHHIKFDNEGNVWLAVYAAHVVQKYTPEGKL